MTPYVLHSLWPAPVNQSRLLCVHTWRHRWHVEQAEWKPCLLLTRATAMYAVFLLLGLDAPHFLPCSVWLQYWVGGMGLRVEMVVSLSLTFTYRLLLAQFSVTSELCFPSERNKLHRKLCDSCERPLPNAIYKNELKMNQRPRCKF